MFYIYMFSVIIKLHSVYKMYIYIIYTCTYMDAHRYTTSPSKIVFTCVPRSRYWAKNCEQVACDECAVRKKTQRYGKRDNPKKPARVWFQQRPVGGSLGLSPRWNPELPEFILSLFYSASSTYTLGETPDPWSHSSCFPSLPHATNRKTEVIFAFA